VESAAALARGMQALGIRLTKGLNPLAARRGGVFVDRYHAHALTGRRETANAVRYVLDNYRHNARETLPRSFRDPLSSAIYTRECAARRRAGGRAADVALRIGWKLERPQRRLTG
jgi:hypothetical protein